jgi:hypothetical protein
MDLFSMRAESTRDSGAVPGYSAKNAVGGFFNDGGVFVDRSVGVKGVLLYCCIPASVKPAQLKKIDGSKSFVFVNETIAKFDFVELTIKDEN